MRRRHITEMLVAIVCIVVILFVVLLATPASAYEGEQIWTKKQIALHEAADILRAAGYAEDSDVLRALGAQWRAEQEALNIVARVVQGEAGGCPAKHQIAVAAVVVNRVNDPRFPNSVREVVAAPRQYTTLYLTGFDKTSRACYEAARIALDGEDDVPDDVVWQAEFRQGTEVWWQSDVNTGWYSSTTYFCR